MEKLSQPDADPEAEPMKAGPKGASIPTFAQPVPYRQMLRWGRAVVSTARWPFLISVALGLVAQLLQQGQTQLVGAVIGRLQPNQTKSEAHGWLLSFVPSGLFGALLVAVVVALAALAFTAGERVTTQWADGIMLGRLQRRLHDALLRLGPTYHLRHSVGETTTIVARLAGGAQLLLRDVIACPVVQGVSLVSALAMLSQNLVELGDVSWHLKLILLGGVLAMPAASGRIASLLRRAFTDVRDSELALTEELQNSLAQPLEVQLMGACVQRSDALEVQLKRHTKNRFAATARNELASQFQGALPTLLQLAFLVYAVSMAISVGGQGAVAAVIKIYFIVPFAIGPLQQLVQFFKGLSTSWPYVEKVIEVLEAKPDIVESLNPIDLPGGPGIVELKDVTFSYGPQLNSVLKGISVSFEPGRTTAIVGASGSGKSTIFNLIARLSDPLGGRVCVSGVDIRDVRLADLRRKVVRVAQFPLFIADTVRANFQLAKIDATDGEIEAVCRETGLWDMLMRASGGRPLDYLLPRDMAQGLSGGQRRLLAVSRALLYKPSVLLLDEPTAGLDNLTLHTLTQFIKRASAGMTVLVIDHDIEGFISRVADHICVLDGGRIVASGTHAQLMSQDGLYRKLGEASSAIPEERKTPTEMGPIAKQEIVLA